MEPPSKGENSPATRRDAHPNPYLITGPDTPPTNSLVGDGLPGRITHSPISEGSQYADQGKKRLKTGLEPHHMDTDVEYPTLEWTNPELNSSNTIQRDFHHSGGVKHNPYLYTHL